MVERKPKKKSTITKDAMSGKIDALARGLDAVSKLLCTPNSPEVPEEKPAAHVDPRPIVAAILSEIARLASGGASDARSLLVIERLAQQARAVAQLAEGVLPRGDGWVPQQLGSINGFSSGDRKSVV